MTAQTRALLVDGLNLIRRVYAAVPGEQGSDEQFESAVSSMKSSLLRAIDTHQPTHAVVVFDGSGESWRHREFPGYKADRKPMPERLSRGLDDIKKQFELIGVASIEVDGFEADDVLATLARGIAARDGRSIILSTDKHLSQAIAPGVVVYDHFSDKRVDAAAVEKRFGVSPALLSTMFALAGDTGVSVPGVKGVGQKTAATLVAEHGDLESILAAASDIPGKLGERLVDGAEDARLALRVLSLKSDVEVGANLKDLRFRPGGES